MAAPAPPYPWRRVLRAACLASVVLSAGACSRSVPPWAKPALVFPPPPEAARVQYLGSVSSPSDLPSQQSGWAEFVVGPREPGPQMMKPIAALLSGNRLYVCDTMLNTVLVYDMATGEARPLRGDRGMGKIRQANNLAIDEEGRLYVADKLRSAVLVYGADEEFLHAWGRPDEAAPVAVAVGADGLYVCDIADHEIEVWDKQTGALLRTIGGRGNTPGFFAWPTQIALGPDGVLHVTDTGNFRVQKLTNKGEALAQIGRLGRNFGEFALPKGMDVDGHGRVYVADARLANVQIFDREGRLLLFFGGPGADAGNLDLPAGLRVHPWPSVPWLNERVAAGFDPEYLVIVVNQGTGNPKFINFFAVARDEKADRP